MAEVIAAALEAMREKFPEGFDGAAKFVIEGEGALVLDPDGVRVAEPGEAAEVTLMADVATFRAILDGDLSPMVAYMTGRLGLKGDMGTALRLGNRMG